MKTRPENEATARVARDKAEVRQSRGYLIAGLLISLVGFVFLGLGPVFGVLLLILGVSLIIAGSRISQRWRCSDCGNITDRKARRCSSCGVRLA